MPRPLTRRLALLLPVIVAACGTEEEPPTAFAPLRYDYLPPIGLNVATIEIRQQFFPSGARPNVTAQDPVPPIAALRAMAQDRLKTYGTSGKAVFSILDASLSQRGDVIDGSMLVTLTILGDDNRELGVARAQVTRRRTGPVNGLRRTLYEFTKAMMNDMNIEFEYQIRHTLKAFIVEPAAPEAPVEQMPLDGRQAPPLNVPATPSVPQGASPSTSLTPTQLAPTQLTPMQLAPPSGAPADPFAVPPADPFGVPAGR